MPLSIESASPDPDLPLDPNAPIVARASDPDGSLSQGGAIFLVWGDYEPENVYLNAFLGDWTGSNIDTSVPGHPVVTLVNAQPHRRDVTFVFVGPATNPPQRCALHYQLAKSPQPSPFVDTMAQARDRLEAIAARNGSQFKRVRGDKKLEDEPSTAAFRWFDIRAESEGAVVERMMAERSRQTRRRFAVRIRYDARNAQQALEDLMAQDDEAITVLEMLPLPAGAEFLQLKESSRRDDPGGYVVRKHVFELLFTHPLDTP